MHKAIGAGRTSLYLIRPDDYVGFRNQPACTEDFLTDLDTIFLTH